MGLLNELCLLSLLLAITGVYGGEYCFYASSHIGTRWCTYGCCGYLNSQCCSANVALIVGLTVTAILVVSGIIAIACCCMRRRAAAGQVITTNPQMGPGAIVVNSSNQMGMASAGQPVPYNTQAYPPGAYAPQPYPMGQQPYPAPVQPSAAALAPPPYSQVTGLDNKAYAPGM